jgi:hypothetical protein
MFSPSGQLPSRNVIPNKVSTKQSSKKAARPLRQCGRPLGGLIVVWWKGNEDEEAHLAEDSSRWNRFPKSLFCNYARVCPTRGRPRWRRIRGLSRRWRRRLPRWLRWRVPRRLRWLPRWPLLCPSHGWTGYVRWQPWDGWSFIGTQLLWISGSVGQRPWFQPIGEPRFRWALAILKLKRPRGNGRWAMALLRKNADSRQ